MVIVDNSVYLCYDNNINIKGDQKMSYSNEDRIAKENGLILLTVDQVCSAGIMYNVYTGTRKLYVDPFVHTVWVKGDLKNNIPGTLKEIGLAIRIDNSGLIISNPSYRGIAIIAFLDKKYEGKKIHSVKVTKVNKRSVNVEPIEFLDN
jgi:hypothetical protein